MKLVKLTNKQKTDRQTDGQTNRHTNRQTDRQADRQMLMYYVVDFRFAFRV